MRKLLTVPGLALALLACVAGIDASAAAQDFAHADSKADPLEALKPAMDEQDRLVDAGRVEEAVARARERAKDGTAESYYVLGHTLGAAAVARAERQLRERLAAAKPEANGPRPEMKFDTEAGGLLDEARDAFERSNEAGGALFAPAHLGLAHVALCKADVNTALSEFRQAISLAKNFKTAAIELAQTLWARKLYPDAEFVLYQFLEVRPKDTDARLILGGLKMERRRWAEAEPEFRTVLSTEPQNLNARKTLAMALVYQKKFDEAAQHLETVRVAEPKDEGSYVYLWQIYCDLHKTDKAAATLHELVRQLPGTEAARRATARLDEFAKDEHAWDTRRRTSQDDLIGELRSTDAAVVQNALEQLREYRMPRLPREVYRLLSPEAGTPGQRLAAVRLIGDTGEPQTLAVFEIMLFHPTDRDPDLAVRRAVAFALSTLPTDAVVPVLFEALNDPDTEIREAGVQGIATRTGKWFRSDLAVRTPDAEWPAQRETYRRWWTSSSASTVKRSAAAGLSDIYARVESKGAKVRIAGYALPLLDDPIESTWRAGYDLFRALTFVTFGSESGSADGAERRRIADEARRWYEQKMRSR